MSIPHVAALDGLRGAAVVAVLLFHGGHLTGGYLGVDLFFVLSGFLITSLLLAESSTTGHVALGGFWARRARRLLPALVLVLLGVAVYALVLAEPVELARIRGDALATIGYVANWRSILAGQDYWALFRTPSPLEHTWSLAIEEQFYLVWPLVFVGLLAWWKRATPKAVLVTALVLGVISSVLMVTFYDGVDPSRAYYGTDTRAAAVLMGAALAAAFTVWGHVRGRGPRLALEAAGLGGVTVLALAWLGLGGQEARLYRGGFLVVGIAAITVIAAAVHPVRGVLSRLFAFRPLCLVGLISYGLYLWHWPVDIVLDAPRTGLTGWPLFALDTAVASAIAVASYQLVEMPIRRGALSARQWRVVVPSVATVVVLIVVLSTAAAENSAPAAASTARMTSGGVLVVGDSVAHSLTPGLVRKGLAAQDVWAPACRLLHGTLRFDNQFSRDCPWPRLFRIAVEKARPRTVVLVIGAWDLFDIRLPGSREFQTPGSPAWAREYAAALERAIAILGVGGARIVMPTLPCMSTTPGVHATEFVHGPVDVARVRAANAVTRLVASRHPGRVAAPDLFPFLCPLGKYQPGLFAVAKVRTDGVHYSDAGADLVARWLVPWLITPGTATTAAAPRLTTESATP